TFAVNAGEISKDFDFFQSTLNIQGEMPQKPSINAAAAAAATTGSGSSNGGTASETKRILTLEEVEAQMLQAVQVQKAQAREALKAKRRAERERRRAEQAKYNNMMTNYDKNYVMRIQMAQLVTEDPFSEDFYNHMYQLIHANEAEVGGSLGGQAQGGRVLYGRMGRGHRSNTQGGLSRMQQQVQRMINNAKSRSKSHHTSLEGALGKVSVTSVRNPKQVIQVKRQNTPGPADSPVPLASGAESSTPHTTADSPVQPSAPALPKEVDIEHGSSSRPYSLSTARDTRRPEIERRNVLWKIERVYSAVLKLEQLVRDQPRLPRQDDHPDVVAWRQSYATHQNQLWELLDVKQPLMDVHPHPFVRFLSIPKGKQIISRVAHHLLPERMLALITTLIANFESLDVCRAGRSAFAGTNGLDAKRADKIETFMNTVVPPVVSHLVDAPLYIINGLLALYMERNDVTWVSKTKPGMVILTIFLSRIELIKQQATIAAVPGTVVPPPPADPQEIFRSGELYNLLFDRLKHQFASLLPSQASIARSPESIGNDTYIWQFLASMAVGASTEQQHVLVEAVQEKVLYSARLATQGFLPQDAAARVASNVNLFLKALGLDISALGL
ncbi:DNA topoisomerase 2-associated protein pat1, partial [Spiromyces aspiralis]